MKQERNAGTLFQADIAAVRALLAERRAADAAVACEQLANRHPGALEPLLLKARASQQQGRLGDMLQLCREALARAPEHVGVRLQFVEACMFNGQHDVALNELQALERTAGDDHNLLQHIGEFFAHAGRHAEACRCYERAVALAPGDARALYNLASAQIVVGKLEDAERCFCGVIERDPHDYDAWQNRSTLRRQTAALNHIAGLSELLEGGLRHPSGEVALCYALAKEYEDLGEFETGFHFLKRGADCRRRLLSYNVQNDVAVMQRLQSLFDRDFAARARSAGNQRGPVFVMGLPRSGTTLVERILSSHSRIGSLGEINDFALTLTRLAGTANKERLLEASSQLDMDALGNAYVQSTRRYGSDDELLIDKTPSNYLYLGLIAKALPGAVIFHVHRHPLDSCYAMYRSLFRMGYPFSYDLADLGSYYVAYHRLMQHWRDTFPGTFIDVSYEELVDNQETVSRALVTHCEVDWEDACLRFEHNTAPVTTASAVQVRRPIYRDALARWRRYERQLEPLIRILADAGIAVARNTP